MLAYTHTCVHESNSMHNVRMGKGIILNELSINFNTFMKWWGIKLN